MVCADAEMEQGVVSEGQAAEGGVSVAWVLFQARQETGRAERVSSCGWSRLVCVPVQPKPEVHGSGE